MKSLLTLTSLIAASFTAAAPIQRPQSQTSAVTLRLINSLAQHYAPSHQTPSELSGDRLHVLVGQTLSLDQDPLHLQAIEIVEVSEGKDLSSPPRKVEKNDEGVMCEALMDFSSRGRRFSGVGRVMGFDEGAMARVTGLSCWL